MTEMSKGSHYRSSWQIKSGIATPAFVINESTQNYKHPQIVGVVINDFKAKITLTDVNEKFFYTIMTHQRKG